MKAESIKFKTVDQYISGFTGKTRSMLEEMRKIIQSAAPDAVEVISYNMPAYKQNGVLVYFAGYAGHIGFYPTSSGIKVFEKDLSGYETSKGTIRFPVGEPLPQKLIVRIVKFRITEDAEKAKRKLKKK